MSEMKKCANKDHVGDPLLEATLEKFNRDSKSSDGLGSWCKVCQNGRYESKNKPSEMNPADFMMDGQGRFVHVDNVTPVDKIRDELVKKYADEAQTLQNAMRVFKEKLKAEIEAFVSLSAQEYGVKCGGEKGNMTLYSFDTKTSINIQVQERMVFDERLQIAKKMIDDCLNKWTENGQAEIRTIINDAFAVDQAGKISMQSILSLRRHNIQNPLWKKAMAAISDSLQVAGSRKYFRLYKRTGTNGQDQNITLDFSKL